MSDDDGMPTMNCPKCGTEMVDFDGFGVIAHPTLAQMIAAGIAAEVAAKMPSGCGFCRHMSRTKHRDAKMFVCDYCGKEFTDSSDDEVGAP